MQDKEAAEAYTDERVIATYLNSTAAVSTECKLFTTATRYGMRNVINAEPRDWPEKSIFRNSVMLSVPPMSSTRAMRDMTSLVSRNGCSTISRQ